MNWAIVEKLIPQFVEAAGLTLRIGVIGVIGAFVVGLLMQLIAFYKVPVIHQAQKVYFEISRNTPLIIQLFFLYYALPKLGLNLDAEVCAITGLIFLGGSYMFAAISSGVGEVPAGEVEGALTLGLTRSQLLRLLVLPQGLKLAVPGIFANFVFLIKETSVFSAIAVVDLMAVAKDIIGMTYDASESLFLLVLSYVVILAPFVVLYYVLQRYLGRGFAGVARAELSNKGGAK